MPGSSLWLLPPPSSSFNSTLQSLISHSIPSLFPSTQVPHFIPHITLTSHIPSGSTSSDPQAWLTNLSLPSLSSVKIQSPKVGTLFFQKLTLACEKSHELTALAKACRSQAVGDDVVAFAEGYYPHTSLMYADIPPSDVTAKLPKISDTIHSAQAMSPGCQTAKGGSIVLVPTDKDIKDWQPMASRELPELEWSWET